MGETQKMNPQEEVLSDFEQKTGSTTQEAAKLLGLAYPRYMEYRRMDRALKMYHHSSIEAHLLLSKKNLKARQAKARLLYG
jgi:hypothetical protein